MSMRSGCFGEIMGEVRWAETIEDVENMIQSKLFDTVQSSQEFNCDSIFLNGVFRISIHHWIELCRMHVGVIEIEVVCVMSEYHQDAQNTAWHIGEFKVRWKLAWIGVHNVLRI